MKVKSIITILILMVASMQTMFAQGFRVYKSDGTVAQFSLRTDSIVFYDNLGSDEDFGPFTPVNQCIVGTWYMSRAETVTFNEDGTTDYMDGATYVFLPYQGSIIIYNTDSVPMIILKLHNYTAEQLIVSKLGSNYFSVWTKTPPPEVFNYVSGIYLSETELFLQPEDKRYVTANVLPEDANNKEIVWESSDEDVATVTDGLIVAVADGTCVITCNSTDGSGVKAECQVQVMADTHEYVDLGLPSGTLWATCNVGAEKPEQYGSYFAWGETKEKDTYNWNNYKYCNGSKNTLTKYCLGSLYGTVDNKSELEPIDDAATVNWGGNWQMPDYDQIEELINGGYTTIDFTRQNAVYGMKVTSKSNGNSIFLPCPGHITEDDGAWGVNSTGFYMSRTLFPGRSYEAMTIYWDHGWSTAPITNNEKRAWGQSVRPVRKQ